MPRDRMPRGCVHRFLWSRDAPPACYDPYDDERGGFRLAEPLLDRVLGQLQDVLAPANACRAFHDACTGRPRGLPAEVVTSIRRLEWARGRGCAYSPRKLAVAAATGGHAAVLRHIEHELPRSNTTWRVLGAVAARARQWEVVRLAHERCPDQDHAVLAGAVSAGHVLGHPARITRVSDLLPRRIADEVEQQKWLASLADLPTHRRRVVDEDHRPVAVKILDHTDWLASSVECVVTTEPGVVSNFIVMPRDADIVTDIRPLGDYQVGLTNSTAISSSASLLPIGPMWFKRLFLQGHWRSWGVAYTRIILSPRARRPLYRRHLVDGDMQYTDGEFSGTMQNRIDALMLSQPFIEWMKE
jgi:hypothetical protein